MITLERKIKIVGSAKVELSFVEIEIIVGAFRDLERYSRAPISRDSDQGKLFESLVTLLEMPPKEPVQLS